jgi:hypothetical protein
VTRVVEDIKLTMAITSVVAIMIIIALELVMEAVRGHAWG